MVFENTIIHMAPAEIIELQKKVPFTGLRIVLTDGQTYDVRHPELMLVLRRVIHLALPSNGEKVPMRAVYIDPMHVVRIEPIPPGNSGGVRKRNGRKRKD